MPSIVHALGQLEHVYDRLNLKLRTSGCFTLSSPQAFEFPFSVNFHDQEALVSSNLWIAGGNRLAIKIRVLFDDIELEGLATSQALEDLGIVLCNAEIWSQLNLSASLNLPRSPVDDGAAVQEILISLTGQPFSHVDLQPPTGIPSACLDSIDLKLNLSTCRRTRVPSKAHDKPIMPGRNINWSQPAMAHVTCEYLDQCRDLPRLSQLSVRTNGKAKPGEQFEAPNFSVKENGLSSASSQSISPMTPPMHFPEDLISTQDLRSVTGSVSCLDSSASRSQYVTHKVGFEDMLKVVNASLQVMICDRMPSKAGGIVMSSNTGHPKLAALSPALFSPGYAQALSRRGQLLPKISHSMSGIYRRTRSVRLGRKIEKLLDIAPDKYREEEHPSCNDDGSPSSKLMAAINARLWFLIQQRLIDPIATTRFKSLDGSRRLSKLGPASEDMLEDFLAHEEDDEPLYDSQDTLWDEDLGQYEGNSHSRMVDFGDLGDDLLMDEETLVEDQIANSDLFWEELDKKEEFPGLSQDSNECTTTRVDLNEGYHELLEDVIDDILDDQIVDEDDGGLTRHQLGGSTCRKELWEDTEMSINN